MECFSKIMNLKESGKLKVSLKCVSASIPAPGGATSILEYGGPGFAPAMETILRAVTKTGALPTEVGANPVFAAMFASILEVVPDIGQWLGNGVISSWENSFCNKRGVKRPVHFFVKEGVRASVHQTFNAFYAEVYERMTEHHAAEDLPELVRTFNAYMRKKFPEGNPKMVWYDRTYEQLLAAHLAADFLSFIGLLASETEERNIHAIEAEMDQLHDARTKEEIVGWTRRTFKDVHIGFITEGDKPFVEEALDGTGLSVVGHNNGSMLVIDPSTVSIVAVREVEGIRVGEDVKPELRNETFAAVLQINGVEGNFGVVCTHFKSGTSPEEQATQAKETVKFTNFLRDWVRTENLRGVIYFGDFNIPGGIVLDLGLEGWRHERTIPADEAVKRRGPHTYQVSKLGEPKKVDYDQGGVCTSDAETHLEMEAILGNGVIPTREHRSDHPVLKWIVHLA